MKDITLVCMVAGLAKRFEGRPKWIEKVGPQGVACNNRLQEMCRLMCKERGAKYYCPDRELLLDNAAMIAYTGELQIKEAVSLNDLDKVDISPRERTDEVEIKYR